MHPDLAPCLQVCVWAEVELSCALPGVRAGLQIHLRHLVGGRARSYMGEIPNERIYQVTSQP
jgi:hypothetical protein